MSEAPRFSNLRYEQLQVGQTFGPFPYDVSADTCRRFAELSGDPHPVFRDTAAARAAGLGDIVPPPGLTTVMFLRALGAGIAGIPPGSILAKQEFDFGEAPRPGECLQMEMIVAEKYRKRERPYVVLEFRVRRPSGALAVVGRKIIIWPPQLSGPAEEA
jgi:acyl dehydratase